MIGLGFDVHKLEAGHTLVLGGVEIESPIGTVAHSDGDVVLHALVDALLGAIGAGDIGEHFPDTDQQWKGAASRVFVEQAMKMIQAANCYVVNADVTLVLQSPKISSYKPAMKTTIAAMCGLDESRVNVKATTSEHLGYAGRKEGVHAWVVVEVQPKP